MSNCVPQAEKPEVAHPSQVEQQLADMDNEVSRAQKHLNILADKLVPILAPERTSETTDDAPEQELVGRARQIRNQVLCWQAINHGFEDLIERLEV